MIRHRVDPNALQQLFNQFQVYNAGQGRLINEISRYIELVVQDNVCIANQSHGVAPEAQLHDLMCDLSYVFTPIPVAGALQQKLQLFANSPIARGVYGRVYSSVFQGNPIVIKAPMRFEQTYIHEV
jgi:hypothetical protein